MIYFVAIVLAVSVLFLEIYSRKRLPFRLGVSFRTDLSLSEPDEIFTVEYTIKNTSALPQLFISAAVYLDDAIELREDEAWKKKYAEYGISGLSLNKRYFLLPHQKVTEKIRLSVKKRGVTTIGTFYLECGDYLGVSSYVQTFEIPDKIVCTSRLPEEMEEFMPRGGMDGDTSVRRFIFEDPTLVYGYRDYTGSEPMKQISWKATARMQRLVVRELDHTMEQEVMVLADLRYERHHQAELERMLELVRGVCERLEELRTPYALITNGDVGEIPEGLGRRHLHAIQRKIGLSRPVAYRRFEEMVRRIVSSPQQFKNYIFIAPEPSPETDGIIRILNSHAASETIVFYGKERAS